MRKNNAPGRKAEGVVCLHCHADIDAYSTAAARIQFLNLRGIPRGRSALLAGLIFGEMAHG